MRISSTWRNEESVSAMVSLVLCFNENKSMSLFPGMPDHMTGFQPIIARESDHMICVSQQQKHMVALLLTRAGHSLNAVEGPQ